ncbi:hypothetical protein G7068_12355 [Leucobacter viscericola]|uniref:Big-1 domain-containing protein n=1 Tax=Leucobacter viscericola TaxID=2714935 RepID=A0A6G7XHH4_9MICO|nr:invasin domain 3-containing protein [Leucobacter viscericola]QIK63899.1 hypothetical protein G7068_12355 [Leucobacter viscericola]
MNIDGSPATADGNASARFSPGPLASKIYSVTGGDVSVEGGSHSVTLALADQYGNPIPGFTGSLLAESQDDLGDGEISAFTESTIPGTYEAKITSTSSGSKKIEVSVAGAQATVGARDTASFIPGGVSIPHEGTRYSVTEGDRVVGDGTHTVTVTLVDKYGNPVPGQAAGLSATIPEALGTGGLSEFEETSTLGTYTATLASTIAGAKDVAILHGGDRLTETGNKVAKFIPGAIDSPAYTVSLGSRVVGEDAHTVTVKLADKYGNVVSGMAAELKAATTDELGEGAVSAFVETGTPGTYTATVASTRSGGKQMTVSLTGNPVTVQGNAVALFGAGAVSSIKYVITTGEEMVGSGKHTVTIMLADKYGNPVPGQSGKLKITAKDDLGKGSISDIVETDVPGTYTATITSTIAGTKALTITVDGVEDVEGVADGNDAAHFAALPQEKAPPAPAPELAATGGSSVLPVAGISILLLLVGGALLVFHNRGRKQRSK